MLLKKCIDIGAIKNSNALEYSSNKIELVLAKKKNWGYSEKSV